MNEETFVKLILISIVASMVALIVWVVVIEPDNYHTQECQNIAIMVCEENEEMFNNIRWHENIFRCKKDPHQLTSTRYIFTEDEKSCREKRGFF